MWENEKHDEIPKEQKNSPHQISPLWNNLANKEIDYGQHWELMG